MSTMGERIKLSRESKNLFQSELAKLVGAKSGAVISNWEKDINKPDAEKIIKLCQALNISASYLLGYNGNEDSFFQPSEIEIITKYRALDRHGKEVIDFLLDKEYERSSSDLKQPDEFGFTSESDLVVVPNPYTKAK